MDDYISRKAAIEDLSAEALERNLDSVMTDDAHRYHRAAERVIAGVPAADVRSAVHGQWIYDCERTMGDGWTYKQRHCSECGYQTVECNNFCQYCGADMREAHDGI